MTFITIPVWAFVLLILLGIPTGFFILMIPLVLITIFISDRIEDHLIKKQNGKDKTTH